MNFFTLSQIRLIAGRIIERQMPAFCEYLPQSIDHKMTTRGRVMTCEFRNEVGFRKYIRFQKYPENLLISGHFFHFALKSRVLVAEYIPGNLRLEYIFSLRKYFFGVFWRTLGSENQHSVTGKLRKNPRGNSMEFSLQKVLEKLYASISST